MHDNVVFNLVMPPATDSEKTPSGYPRHVAIIMDGNGRWAKARGLPRNEGHRKGAESVRNVLQAARDFDIPMLTIFAFSVENWRRPEDEISALWRLLDYFLDRNLKDLIENEIRLNVLGRVHELPDHICSRIENAIKQTSRFTRYQCNVALNYGSRTEVIDAVKACAQDIHAGKLIADKLNWDTFNNYLYTANLPDPDLLIRTSGESRISNFLLLQLAYAELYFTPVLWPDFGRDEFFQAIEAYKSRERRFGMIGEQLHAEPAISTQ